MHTARTIRSILFHPTVDFHNKLPKNLLHRHFQNIGSDEDQGWAKWKLCLTNDFWSGARDQVVENEKNLLYFSYGLF